MKRNFISFFIVLITLSTTFFSTSSRSDSIYLGAWSEHFGDYPEKKVETKAYACPQHRQNCAMPTPDAPPKHEFNETNNLIAYEHNGYGGGYYLNSYNQHTVFLQKQFDLARFGDFDLKANAGINYGYRGCDFKNDGDLTVCPDLSLELSYAKYDIQPALILKAEVVSFTTKWIF